MTPGFLSAGLGCMPLIAAVCRALCQALLIRCLITSRAQLLCRACSWPHFPDEGTEAEIGCGTHCMGHSWGGTEPARGSDVPASSVCACDRRSRCHSLLKKQRRARSFWLALPW